MCVIQHPQTVKTYLYVKALNLTRHWSSFILFISYCLLFKFSYIEYYLGEAPNKPVPVFPWHSLVPFLTNTGPSSAKPAPPTEPVHQPAEAQLKRLSPAPQPLTNQNEPHTSISEAGKILFCFPVYYNRQLILSYMYGMVYQSDCWQY